jgi:branched-chain amino acid transport system permease protein
MRLLCLFLLFFGACSPVIPPDQNNLCELILPALDVDARDFTITHHEKKGDPVRVNYNAMVKGETKNRFVICHMKQGLPEILKLETQGGIVSEAALFMIKRFYIPEHYSVKQAYMQPKAYIKASPEIAYFTQILLNALPLAGIYALMALAYSLIYQLQGRVLFGLGETAIIASYAALSLASSLSLGLGLALLTALCFMNLAAKSIIKPLYNSSGLIIATLGLTVIVSEGLRLLIGSSAFWITPPYAAIIPLVEASNFIATTNINSLLTGFCTLGICTIALYLFIKSKLYQQWQAVCQDSETAALFAISPAHILTKTTMISATLAGLAGFAMSFHYGMAHYSFALLFGLKAIIASIVGRTLLGAIMAGIGIALLESFWAGFASGIWREAIVFILLTAVICLKLGEQRE